LIKGQQGRGDLATFDFFFFFASKSLVHLFELLDGHVHGQVKDVHGKPLNGTKSIVETCNYGN